MRPDFCAFLPSRFFPMLLLSFCFCLKNLLSQPQGWEPELRFRFSSSFLPSCRVVLPGSELTATMTSAAEQCSGSSVQLPWFQTSSPPSSLSVFPCRGLCHFSWLISRWVSFPLVFRILITMCCGVGSLCFNLLVLSMALLDRPVWVLCQIQIDFNHYLFKYSFSPTFFLLVSGTGVIRMLDLLLFSHRSQRLCSFLFSVNFSLMFSLGEFYCLSSSSPAQFSVISTLPSRPSCKCLCLLLCFLFCNFLLVLCYNFYLVVEILDSSLWLRSICN